MTQAAQKHESQSPSRVNSQLVCKLCFCPLEAEAIGLNEAIVVARLRFWLGRSKHIYGGRPWIYNTYPEWQKQFPFWSVFTVKNIFRRLEELGVLESTQRFNANRWNKTKWYTLNEDVLAGLMGRTIAAEPAEPVAADVAETEVVSMGAEVAMDGQQIPAIEGTETAPIDGVNVVPSLTERSPDKHTKRACACESEGEARPPALENHKLTAPPVVNDLDVAYADIPEAERYTWYERADRALAATGMPEWMRIAPTVKAAAVRMWCGLEPVTIASG
jgi:hypothetical protein